MTVPVFTALLAIQVKQSTEGLEIPGFISTILILEGFLVTSDLQIVTNRGRKNGDTPRFLSPFCHHFEPDEMVTDGDRPLFNGDTQVQKQMVTRRLSYRERATL